MPARLAELHQIIQNAVDVLRKPDSRRHKVLEAVNGRRTAEEISKELKLRPSNVGNDLTTLRNRGFITPVGKKGRSTIYAKIPELRGLNLRPYFSGRGREKLKAAERQAEEERLEAPMGQVSPQSAMVQKVIGLGEAFDIANISQEWVDALVVLNFAETAATKFLMDHGFAEDKVKEMHWNDKLNRVKDKLFEEAAAMGQRPRDFVVSNLESYRNLRNEIDHEAHLPSARIRKPEVDHIYRAVKLMVGHIFQEHKKVCPIYQGQT